MQTDLQVLVVEDNPVNSGLVCAMLKQGQNLRFQTATSLDAARALLQKTDDPASERFDAVLLDLYLPDSEGLDTFYRMRAEFPELALVILSGMADESAALQAVQDGAQDYLVKGRLDAYALLRSLRYAVERKRTEEALRASEERYALIARGVNDGLWDWNLEKDTLYLSPRWKEMLGYRDDEIENRIEEWFSRIHPEDMEDVRSALDEVVDGRSSQLLIECRLQHRGGAYRWMLCRGAAVGDESGRSTRIAGSLTDITDMRLYDRLTGLPNRQLFYERLKHSFLRTQSGHSSGYSVVCVNIDRFALINESFGVLSADRVLQEFARRLTEAVRPDDTIARLGADDFVLLLENIENYSGLQPLQMALQQSMGRPFRTEADEVFLRFSAGVALHDPGHENSEETLRDAQSALARARQSGGNRIEYFEKRMNDRVLERMRLETGLRKGLDQGELRLFYQPKLNLSSGAIDSFEALVRWQHPEHGLLGPGAFIELAEESDLIVVLGEWALAEAVAAIRRRSGAVADGPPPRIAVNVSPRQFALSNLPAYVEALLRETGLPPELLELEFTEGIALDFANASQTLEYLQELRRIGVGMAIDDFGTGYSSLTYLKRLPVDTVKIDREFVRLLPHDPDSRAITAAILAMCRNLGLRTVAEGVEEQSQLEFLRERGCDYAQGYLLARPLPEEEAFAVLRTGAAPGHLQA